MASASPILSTRPTPLQRAPSINEDFSETNTLFIADNKLHYDYNYLNAKRYPIVSPVLPTGKVDLKFNFIKTGKRKGTGELYVNGSPLRVSRRVSCSRRSRNAKQSTLYCCWKMRM
jgi:hypothetical protein